MKSKYTPDDREITSLMESIYIRCSYHANSWLIKITSNGRYLMAPTIYGQIYVFDMRNGNVSLVIKGHDGTFHQIP